jgi:hypothetical protein
MCNLFVSFTSLKTNLAHIHWNGIIRSCRFSWNNSLQCHISSCSFGRITACSQYRIFHYSFAWWPICSNRSHWNKFQQLHQKLVLVAFNYFELSVYRYVRTIILVESFKRTNEAALWFISNGSIIRSSTKSHQLFHWLHELLLQQQYTKGCHNHIWFWIRNRL